MTDTDTDTDSLGVISNIHLRIGGLNYASVSQLRHVLSLCPTGPDVHLVVDLSQADAGHDMTLFALLAGRARRMQAEGGATTALRASTRLTHLLISIGVPVTGDPIPQVQSGAQHLTVGDLVANPSALSGSQGISCRSCA